MSREWLGNPAGYVAAACAANALAFIIPNTSPFAVGALITGFPMNEAEAGLVLTAELSAMGLAALCIAPLMARLSRRRLAIAAAALIAGFNALAMSGLASSLAALTLIRIVAGTGAGVLLATANAAIAAASAPARLYGFALMFGWLLAAALGPVLAWATEHASYAGAYGIWMLLALLALPVLGRLGERMAASGTGIALPRGAALRGTVHLFGIVLTGASMMAYFAFLERLGQRVGFSLSDVGLLFAAVSFAGAAGAGLAGLLGTRFGLLWPLLVGTALHACAIVMAVSAGSKPMFAVAVVGEGVTFMYLLAYQLAVAATFDAKGRWAAAASGAMIGSTGGGPYIGGALITAHGYASLSALTLSATVPALAAFYWVGHSRPVDGAT
jgi:predicted MFS family arabinose efflux permease